MHKPTISALVAAVVTALALGTGSALAENGPTPPGGGPGLPPVGCLVPDVRGVSLATASKLLRIYECAPGKVVQARSGRVPKGRVIAQGTAPGTRLASGAKVRLTVSLGKSR
jgi:hypothetical protein